MSHDAQRKPASRGSTRALALSALVLGVVIVGLAVFLESQSAEVTSPAAVVAAPRESPETLPMNLDALEVPGVLTAPPPEPAPENVAPPDSHALTAEDFELLMAAQLAETVELGLTVLDDAGRPVPDARVDVWPSRQMLDEGEGGPSEVAWTDGLGHARLELAGRRAVVYAVGEERGSTGMWSASALQRLADSAGEVALTLQPDARLHLTVLHADDRPAGFAEVSFLRPTGVGGNGAGRLPAALTTDGEGRATLRVDSLVDLDAVAKLEGMASHPAHITVAPGGDAEATLRFPGRWSVAVVLLDHEGEPAIDGLVEAWLRFPTHDVAAGDFPDDAGVHLSAETDETGSGLIELPRSGQYRLLGTREGDAPSSAVDIFVDDGTPHAGTALQLAESGSIAGRVVRGDNSPIEGLSVSARPAHLYLEEAERYAPTVWRLHGSAVAVTDEQGAFSLGPLHPAGRYVVFCRPVEGRPDLKIVRKGITTGTQDLLLVASDETLRRATLDGHVLTDATGLPVDGYRARLLIELDGRVIETEDRPTISADGGFRFEGLAPDYRYRLRIDGPGLGTVELPWFVADRRGRTEIVRLPPAGRLEVAVVDRRSRPLEYAEVSAVRQLAGWGPDRFSSGLSGPDGRAVFDAIPADRYELTVRLGALTESVEVVIGADEDSRLTVQLDT